MTDFKIVHDERTFTMYFESSTNMSETIEVKIIMYNTLYRIYKKKETGTWHNHISKFELGAGLLKAVGKKLEENLNL